MADVTDVSVKPPVPPVYLGDGCYVEFDGYQLSLFTHDGISVIDRIALDRNVFYALTQYAKRLSFQAA